MKKFYSKSIKRGQPPGTLVYTGEKTQEPSRIRLFNYGEHLLEELELKHVVECFGRTESPATTWINIDGLNDIPAIEKIGTHFNLHSLVIEDILHTHQRPKMEDLGSAIYLVVRMLSIHPTTNEILSEQVSFVLCGNTLLTFQESPGDVFDLIRERIRKKLGRVRCKGADYLLYALMDALIDHYFQVIEFMGEQIEEIETALMQDPYPKLLNDLYAQKRELLYIRKNVWPLREAVSLLERGENSLIDPSNQVFFRDLYDHTIQVIDTVEIFRDMLSGVQDLYLSSLGNKTNQVMKVLTIISTIFIPITFVAGIYGMNFKNMPELQWTYGYEITWGFILAISTGMLFYFRKLKWF